MYERKLLMFGANLLQNVGLHPQKQNLSDKIKLVVGSTLFIAFICLYVAEFILGMNGKETFQNMGEFLVSFYQCFIKLWVAIIIRPKIGNVLMPKIFKFTDMSELDVDLQKDLNGIYGAMEKIIKSYCFICTLVVVLACLRPFIIKSQIFPMPLYFFIDLSKTPQYQLSYLFEIVTWIFLAFMVLGSDVMFFSFIIYIYCEFKIIKYRFQNLIILEEDYQNNFKKVSSLVHHHNLILSCVSDLNSMYSFMFLNQFLTSTFGICMSIFVIITNGFPASIPFILQHVLYTVSGFLQLFFYCFAGTQIKKQSQDVADSVFHASFWMDAPNYVKRGVIMVIQRSQKSAVISVGGMYCMDLELCGGVLKATLSFLNAMLALSVEKK